MGKLSAMPGRLSAIPQRIGRARDIEGHCAEAEPWRAWYSLRRWKLLRMATFERDLFTCQCGCGHIEADTSLLVGDHIEPHRGDPRLFWDQRNVQTLFKSCHDKTKQAQERRARVGPT